VAIAFSTNQQGSELMQSSDYDKSMQRNLTHVFSERDPKKRLEVIRELYDPDAVLNEPEASVTGHEAISDAVTKLLDSLPPDFTFTAMGPAIGHHSIGRLRWQSGPPNGPAAVQGMDIAHFIDGRIHALYVFIEDED
jgi:hypothetical protein